MTRRLVSFVSCTLFLLLAGAIAGLVIAVLGLALSSAIESLQVSDRQTLLGYLADLFWVLIDVLAVSVVAAPSGIWAGLIAAAAVSLCYGLVLWAAPQLQLHRWLLAFLFALVAILAVSFSPNPLLATYGVAAAIGAAIFGLVAGLALSRQQMKTA